MKDQEYLTFAEAARVLPNKPSPSTVYRWYAKGILCGDTRVHLRAHAFGSKLYVTRSDLTRFAVEAAEAKRQKVKAKDAHKQEREAEIKEAELRLQKLGVY